MQPITALSPDQVPTLTPAALRERCLVPGLFQPGELQLRAWETDRTILGGIVPLAQPLPLVAPASLRAEHFLARREAGIINLGGPGTVHAGVHTYALAPHDGLYLGRGTRDVRFASVDPAHPARFYLLSYPAHAGYPTRHVPVAAATPVRLGEVATANRRTIYKLIHPGAFPTCQLVMGFTLLETGSVWNTMPPHTHLRRSEVYLYFDLPATHAVMHFMGEPAATRHLVVRNLDAVLSPPWSIHCGAGTAAYGFVWGMGGENQEFDDMDPAPLSALA